MMPLFRDGAKSTSLLTILYIIAMIMLSFVIYCEFSELQMQHDLSRSMERIEAFSKPA